MDHMSTIMPTPADVAAATYAAIRSLTDNQIAAIMHSSQVTQRRVLPNCWDTVKTAAPDLALALDELHATGVPKDLPRFQALAADHEQQMGDAVKSRAGKGTASLVVTGLLLGVLTAVIGLAGIAGTLIVAGGALLSAAMLLGGYAVGSRIAHRSGNWLLADPEAAASIVWDAGIDAAAATALLYRTGQDGLTSDVLCALSSVWIRAGLDTRALIPDHA